MSASDVLERWVVRYDHSQNKNYPILNELLFDFNLECTNDNLALVALNLGYVKLLHYLQDLTERLEFTHLIYPDRKLHLPNPPSTVFELKTNFSQEFQALNILFAKYRLRLPAEERPMRFRDPIWGEYWLWDRDDVKQKLSLFHLSSIKILFDNFTYDYNISAVESYCRQENNRKQFVPQIDCISFVNLTI